MRKLFVISLIILLSNLNIKGNSFIQYSSNDSLVYQNQLYDSIKKMESLRNISPAECLKFGERVIELSYEYGDPAIIGLTEKTQGVSYFYQGVFDSALYHYKKAIPEFKKVKQRIDIGKVLNNIAIIYRRTNRSEEALEKYLETIAIYESENYLKGIAGVYFNVGCVYHNFKDYPQAEHYYFLALSILQKLEPGAKLARIHMNIGVLFLEQYQFEESLEYFNKAYILNDKYDTPQQKATILLNLGQVAFHKKEYDKALEYYYRCKEIRETVNDYWGLPKIYIYLAECLAEIGKFEEAFIELQASENICRKYNLNDDLAKTYLQKSLLYEETNDASQALENYKKSDFIQDSLLHLNRSSKLDELELEHYDRLRKSELKINNLALSRKNILLLSLIGLFLLATAFVLFYLRSRSYRNKLQTLSLEQKVRLSQMNPHFIFNSLSVIQDFILSNENDKAFKYMSKLSGLVRGVLENSTHEYITVREELDILTAYVELQNLRFGNEISYRFDIDSDIDLDEIKIPPMLAQPIIENALVHGELRENPEAEIKICLLKNKENKSIDFTVEDNGIGILKSKTQNRIHKSMATEILKDRVRIYNYYSKNELSIVVTDLKTLNDDLHGTRVRFSIPLCSN